MTYLLATRFPDAEVIGIDISPVPERYEKVANLTYVQGDIMTVGTQDGDERFKEGSFDYVFHRLLVLGMTNWEKYLDRVNSLLAAGGWAEMQDYEMTIYSRQHENLSDGWWHHRLFKEDCKAIGLDNDVGRKLCDLMRGVHLQDVREAVYTVPCIPSDDLPAEQQGVAKMMHGMATMSYQRALFERVSGGRRSKEELDKMVQGAGDVHANLGAGAYCKMFVAVGQKA